MAGTDWTDAQNDAVVVAYFAMLSDDLAGQPINKAATYRDLAAQINRSAKSIEFKFQNVSAVMVGIGHTWVRGLKPKANYQISLEDAVARLLSRTHLPQAPTAADGLAEPAPLYFTVPPTLQNAPPPEEAERYVGVARRFDAAGRDARNRALGEAGEARVLAHEKSTLHSIGRPDLAKQVEWTSKTQGDGAGYDIASFQPDGTPRLLEVKTTNGWDRTPFHISRNEIRVAKGHPEEWRLVRLYDFSRNAQAFELAPPLERHVALTATSFQADFH